MAKKNFRFYWKSGRGGTSPEEAKSVRIGVPGFRKDEISAVIKGSTLSVNAAKKSHNIRKGRNFYKEEASASSFSRSISVPGLNMNDIEVSIEDGSVVLKKKRRSKKLENIV